MRVRPSYGRKADTKFHDRTIPQPTLLRRNASISHQSYRTYDATILGFSTRKNRRESSFHHNGFSARKNWRVKVSANYTSSDRNKTYSS